MPDKIDIVFNTSPLIGLAAGVGSLDFLRNLYNRVLIPREVINELSINPQKQFGLAEIENSPFLEIIEEPIVISPFLLNCLDIGEASVIQTALNFGIKTVCIDEVVGRRIARINDLKVTGSLGVCMRAKKEGEPMLMRQVIINMQTHGIFLGSELIKSVMELAGE